MPEDRPTARGEAEGPLTTDYRLPELKKGQTLMSVVAVPRGEGVVRHGPKTKAPVCLLYTSDAADE